MLLQEAVGFCMNLYEAVKYFMRPDEAVYGAVGGCGRLWEWRAKEARVTESPRWHADVKQDW